MTTPCFLGFLPKHVLSRPDWLKTPNVELVASVSECMSKSPPDRIDLWQHNELGLYDDETTARGTIPAGSESTYTLFAYRALPLAFREGQERPWDIVEHRGAEPDLAAYEHLGYDVVGYGGSGFFECSPLSCNGMAAEIEVNRVCLVDSAERAAELARDFSREGSRVEPAWAYVVIEVLRRRD